MVLYKRELVWIVFYYVLPVFLLFFLLYLVTICKLRENSSTLDVDIGSFPV